MRTLLPSAAGLAKCKGRAKGLPGPLNVSLLDSSIECNDFEAQLPEPWLCEPSPAGADGDEGSGDIAIEFLGKDVHR